MDWHWPRSACLSTASQGLSLQKHALVHTYINTLSQQCPSHSGANVITTRGCILLVYYQASGLHHPQWQWRFHAKSVIIFFLDYCFLRSHPECVYACQHLCGAHWIKGQFYFFSLLLWPHLSQPLESHNSRYQSRQLTADTVSRKGQKVNTKQGRNILSCNKPQHKTSI